MWTDDPIRDFERYEAEQEEKLEKLPVCDDCGEPIQDEYYYDINGFIICPDCLKEYKCEVDFDGIN